MENLNSDNDNLFKELEALTYKIVNIFVDLSILEINGKKSSEEYQAKLVELQNAIKKEEEFKTKISNEPEALIELFRKLSRTSNSTIKERAIPTVMSCMKFDSTYPETVKKNIIISEIILNINLLAMKFLYNSICEEEDFMVDDDKDNKEFLIKYDYYARRRDKLNDFYHQSFHTLGSEKLILGDPSKLPKDYFFSCYDVALQLGILQEDAQKIIDAFCSKIIIKLICDIFKNKPTILRDNAFKALRTLMSEERFEKVRNVLLKYIERKQLIPTIATTNEEYARYDYVMYLLSDACKPKEHKNPYSKVRNKPNE